ncbi:DUF5060 domain-containing protein [Devosia neptuniae]|jgi:hypothetical protein|uniref:DUF5060 domain-containing protein n=1 Tax=Devosia TaxID=46913 RepID=UPI0022AFC1E0|nr:DUF5060 domain-containing protein [Devosia neptuniae]MCZ4346033.1 DUF5060 domain-containing protein [Devosia neptuniae]|tara:strand:- start:8306 stop:9895 length:1590 start_codon:yes stop_codon:yes gene_type:complete
MSSSIQSSSEASLWATYEAALNGPSEGNPFVDVTLSAVFTQGDKQIKTAGFYDGDGVYRIRFLPETTGEWSFLTRSNAGALDGVQGKLDVAPAKAHHHGPVRPANTFHYRHADGTRHISMGTTAYAWTHQGGALEEQTLASLAKSPFNKIRMCVFPKHYRYNQNEPELYPYEVLSKGRSDWPGKPLEGWSFDFERFNPAFFHHLEKRINDLAAIGVEADLIVLHPYDRWGFSRMTPAQDDLYLRYLVARLSAFPNVWWSMANEYDFMASKSLDDWNRMIEVVSDSDPFDHLLSIHNGFAPFDYNHPKITHVSIQRQDTSRALEWRLAHGKPISDDECSYEGDIAEDWGNISGGEMVHRFWLGMVSGGYMTHGETYYNDSETLWWSKGGKLTGESPARIAFLKRIVEDGPDEGLDPLPHTGRYRIMAAGGLDHVKLPDLIAPMPGEEDWVPARIFYATAGQPHRYYLSYFGGNQPRELNVAVPPNEHYSAELIDTWEMTQTPLADSVKRGDVLHFAPKPYQAVLLKRIDA